MNFRCELVLNPQFLKIWNFYACCEQKNGGNKQWDKQTVEETNIPDIQHLVKLICHYYLNSSMTLIISYDLNDSYNLNLDDNLN